MVEEPNSMSIPGKQKRGRGRGRDREKGIYRSLYPTKGCQRANERAGFCSIPALNRPIGLITKTWFSVVTLISCISCFRAGLQATACLFSAEDGSVRPHRGSFRLCQGSSEDRAHPLPRPVTGTV